MGKRARHPSRRLPPAGRGRWRTAGVVATAVIGVAVVFLLNLVGRGRKGNGDSGPHDHPLGPHGGSVVAIDRGNRYHAEAVVGPGGVVRLFTFAADVAASHPVPANTVCSAARSHDGADEYAVMLRPEPQPGDPPGTASRFVGRLPPAARRGHLRLVVWALPIGAERFVFEIDSQGATPEPAEAERAAEVEATLYTTPGGKYQAEDIRSNGGAVASRRYRGVRSAHDDRPAVGERVCPVSRSRADPRFGWVIDGREYLFCCPPCIDEFVAVAKERPDEVRAPEFYRQK